MEIKNFIILPLLLVLGWTTSIETGPEKYDKEDSSSQKKEFMINYRVQNIEGLVRNLKKSGVTFVDEITEFEYGKFVHII